MTSDCVTGVHDFSVTKIPPIRHVTSFEVIRSETDLLTNHSVAFDFDGQHGRHNFDHVNGFHVRNSLTIIVVCCDLRGVTGMIRTRLTYNLNEPRSTLTGRVSDKCRR